MERGSGKRDDVHRGTFTKQFSSKSLCQGQGGGVRSLHVARGTTESWTVDSANLC